MLIFLAYSQFEMTIIGYSAENSYMITTVNYGKKLITDMMLSVQYFGPTVFIIAV